MKLNRNAVKARKVNQAKKFPTVALVDSLATEYLSNIETSKAYQNRADKAKEQIKALAELHGKTIDNETLMEGKTYVAGYVTPQASPKLDPTLVAQHIPNKFRQQVIKMRPSVDEDILKELVSLGKIDKKTFSKMLIKPLPMSPRLLVELKAKHAAKKEDETAQD